MLHRFYWLLSESLQLELPRFACVSFFPQASSGSSRYKILETFLAAFKNYSQKTSRRSAAPTVLLASYSTHK